MLKKVLLLLLALILVFTLFVGCSKPAEQTNNPTEQDNNNVQENVSETPKEHTVLVFNAATDPPTLDPQLNTKSNGSLINYNLFEGLVKTNSKMEQVPGVAEEWEVNEEGTVYTFHLREDAKWSDGKPITAYDFEYAWKRALDPENHVKYVNHMFYLKNAEPIYNGEMDMSELGVEVIDERTIVAELEAPIPYMLEMFSFGVYRPVRKEIIEANPDNWTAYPETCISNGPFKIKEYKMNEKITLVKDENYWNKDSIKLDELQFVFIEDASTALTAFNSGQIDGLLSVPNQEIPRLKIESKEFNIKPRLKVYYVAFNVTEFPFDNPKVREAFTLAIDREQMVNTVSLGGETPATGFVPYGLMANGEDFRKNGGEYGINKNVQMEKAKQALKDAGYPNGEGWPEHTEYLYNTSETHKKIAEALQEMWSKNLNIDIKLTNVESKVHSERRHNGQFQIARAGWGADYNHPMTFLDLFTSDAGNNTPQYRVSEYDDLIRQAKLSTDPKECIELLHKAEDKLMGDWVVCPIYYSTQTIMMKNKIKNWNITPFGDVNFDELYIEE